MLRDGRLRLRRIARHWSPASESGGRTADPQTPAAEDVRVNHPSIRFATRDVRSVRIPMPEQFLHRANAPSIRFAQGERRVRTHGLVEAGLPSPARLLRAGEGWGEGALLGTNRAQG